MVDERKTGHRVARSILTEPFGALRMVGALLPVWYAILARPKDFFVGIGGASGLKLRNAAAFSAMALVIYVSIQTAFEEILIHGFDFDGATFVAYYAADYHETFGWPLADGISFFTILAMFAAVAALDVLNIAGSAWLFLRSYVHFGEIASFKAVLVAVLYAASFITLTFCVVSVPLILLSDRDDPTALFYFFGPLTTSQSRYELVLAYFFVRAISFTTNVMLHWGMVFTLLLVTAIAWIGRLY